VVFYDVSALIVFLEEHQNIIPPLNAIFIVDLNLRSSRGMDDKKSPSRAKPL
jgi:hypothetical protein